MFIADNFNHAIRRIDLATGQVSTFAGTGASGFVNGDRLAALFNRPYGISFDTNGNLYVADHVNHAIRRIDRSTGQVSTFAGTGTSGLVNGDRLSAQFSRPYGLSFDANGNLFVADLNNHVIRRIDRSTGQVITFAGTGASGFQNGDRLVAKFNQPYEVVFDSIGNLLVVDCVNHVLRRIDISTGQVSTFAGTGTSGFKNGERLSAQFAVPTALTSDSGGNLFTADHGNHAIRGIYPINSTSA